MDTSKTPARSSSTVGRAQRSGVHERAAKPIALIFGDLLQISIGVMAALQVALGAALLAKEA